MNSEFKYTLSVTLSVLKDLGINLYTSTPAVLAEAVANAWDADAEEVDIHIDLDDEKVVIRDDGHGMSASDLDLKYLTVGYERREHDGEAVTPKHNRDVMGRKGIGKLSLFSIAKEIEVHSVKGGEKSGLRMKLDDIFTAIKEDGGEYHPEPVNPDDIEIEKGTEIRLRNLRRKLTGQTIAGLRKRLARRFSIIGEKYSFNLRINESEVTIADRDYFHKVQYLWSYGDTDYKTYANNATESDMRPGVVDPDGFEVSGWIGTSLRSTDLKDPDENINRIVVIMRGKLAHEDLLASLGKGGVYTNYVFGELHADFLDSNEEDDAATSNRQQIKEDDPRFRKLQSFVEKELNHIDSVWTKRRNESGKKEAVKNPAIKKWFEDLKPDAKKRAEKLFGRINRLGIDDPEERSELFKHGVLAFETLHYKEALDALDSLDIENVAAFTDVFARADEIEATLYHQIVEERLRVIQKLQEKVEDNALEKVLQEYLFDHLWLLDPSWDRATETPVMEKKVKKLFDGVKEKEDSEISNGRVDIKYKTTAGKHVIVELKRAGVKITAMDLIAQTTPYRDGLKALLSEAGKHNEPVEVVCVVGQEPTDFATDREQRENMLEAAYTRVKTFTQLIEDAYASYKQFLEKSEDASRINRLIADIETHEKILP
ncbi:MAG: ATP-binding protein [Pseudomonadota bacterium]